MRKRMSRMKKEMAVAVAAAMCISLVGCGGGSSKKVVADIWGCFPASVQHTSCNCADHSSRSCGSSCSYI